MIWEKLGKIWKGSDHLIWGEMGTLTPTPYLMGNGTIRVFCGLRDHSGVGRIGFFDVDENNPKKILGCSPTPVLDIGIPGMFDDNGMLLGDVIRVKDELRMYYVGFQLGVRAKFLAFGGLAISKDNGETFHRFRQTPIMDRDDSGSFIRAIHGIRQLSDGKFQVWFSEGNSWEYIDKKPYPNYSVATLVSDDGLFFRKDQGEKINIERHGEYRLGRSRVFSLDEDNHILTFTYGKTDGEYQSGYAHSTDLEHWERQNDWGLTPGPEDFDSEHLAYPALIKNSNGDTYCFYNGNNMGEGGIGVAKLVSF